METASEDLSALIARVMDSTGLSQSDIAMRSGIPLATINAWVMRRRGSGGKGPAPERLRALAEALPGVTVAEVFETVGRRVPAALSPDAEKRVLELYRNLSPGRQQLAARMLETLAAEERD